MSESTNIAWATHTASPHLVCTEADPCCANCYSREFAKMNFGKRIRETYRKAGFANWEEMPAWGDRAPRIRTKGFWNDAYVWNKKARERISGNDRPRIFTSMIDWLDPMPSGLIDSDGNHVDPAKHLADFMRVVRDCKNLDWLLLSKRIEKWSELLHAAMRAADDDVDQFISQWLDGDAPENVWFGFTAGTQKTLDERAIIAKDIPAEVLWVSCEPMLENMDFSAYLKYLDWVVAGLESGPKRRVIPVEPIINVAQQCVDAGVPVFVKQDAHLLPGQQGRIPDEIWAMKQFPKPKSQTTKNQ